VETINSRIREDLVVLVDTQFNDLLSENITVIEGVTIRIYGIVQKKLIVEKNAVVYLHGKVLGEIINNGGTVYVFGTSGTVTTY
jgi:hypothetical protein